MFFLLTECLSNLMLFQGFLMALLIVLKQFVGLLLLYKLLSEHMLRIFQSNIIFHKFYVGYCCWYKSPDMFHKSLFIRSCWVQTSQKIIARFWQVLNSTNTYLNSSGTRGILYFSFCFLSRTGVSQKSFLILPRQSN